MSIMDYQKHYDALIKRAKERTVTSYTETHHVLPKCLGGNDTPDNLVKLFPEEHYIAHLLLVKIYEKMGTADVVSRLSSAANMMLRGHSGKRTNKSFGVARRMFSEHHPAKQECIKSKIRDSLKKHRELALEQHDYNPFQRVCLVSFCKLCNETIPNKKVTYCSEKCMNSKFTHEVRSNLSYLHKKRLASLTDEEMKQRIRDTFYKDQTPEKNAQRIEKIKQTKAKEKDRILSMTDEEFYATIKTMSLYRKDGARNGNLVKWLVIRGLDVHGYYNKRV